MKFVLFSPRKRFVCGTPALGSASRMRSTLENFDAFENNLDSDYHIFADYVDTLFRRFWFDIHTTPEMERLPIIALVT